MKRERKMALVINQVKMEDEDTLDLLFWLQKSPTERLSEVNRLRRNYFTSTDKPYPNKIEKVVHRRKL